MNIIRRFLGWLACEPKEYINPAIPLSVRWKAEARMRSHKCPRCDGSGFDEREGSECSKCDGTGFWGSKERQAMIDLTTRLSP